MENASKALIMAASILLSLMVISTVVLMYNKISDAQQAKVNSEEAEKLTEYSLKFEKYNRTIYGSELMSLANLQEDYNLTQTGEKGYEAVNITVEIKRGISGTSYFSAGNKNMVSFTTDKNALEDEIREYEENKKYKGRVVKYYAQMSNKEIAQKYGVSYLSSETDYDIGDRLRNSGGEIENLMEDIDRYEILKSIYTEFKNKRFKCTQIGYGQTGRVNLLKYTEIL